MLAWLCGHCLEEYHEVMVREGFDDIMELAAMGAEELQEVFQLIGTKPGHRKRFQAALKAAPASGPASIGEEATRACGASSPPECPVCLAPPASGSLLALVPCFHVLCPEHAESAQRQGRCPLCRGQPTGTQQLFF